jgi:magnesium chelatase subunit I
MIITEQEAWIDRHAADSEEPSIVVPDVVREVVEEVAFQARGDQRVDRRSGVSQRLPITLLETVISNAERRALVNQEHPVVPRVSDIYASLPSITGKIELEYEGELKGAETVARDLVRSAVATVFDGRTTVVNTKPIITWFENGGTIDLSDTTSAAELLDTICSIDRLEAAMIALGAAVGRPAPERAAVADFVLEGLSALKKISRSDQGQFFAPPPAASRTKDRQTEARSLDALLEEEGETEGGRGKRKKYYN